ncbi:hypothetical protein [Burkholderia sp. MSMB617WGS]|uniref:hypothetical protein n=1 Tax=Burkholderia sp. MSMB617WGS TaxID=1637831 RepID=UPI0016480279|nr:hypothetical protein [Burkholderia sp. MSMB617WGS]
MVKWIDRAGAAKPARAIRAERTTGAMHAMRARAARRNASRRPADRARLFGQAAPIDFVDDVRHAIVRRCMRDAAVVVRDDADAAAALRTPYRAAVCGLRFAVCGLRFAVCGLRFAVCGWRLAVGGWRLAVGGWRLAVGGWRLAVGGSRFAVRGSRFAVRGSRFAVRGSRFANTWRKRRGYVHGKRQRIEHACRDEPVRCIDRARHKAHISARISASIAAIRRLSAGLIDTLERRARLRRSSVSGSCASGRRRLDTQTSRPGNGNCGEIESGCASPACFTQ